MTPEYMVLMRRLHSLKTAAVLLVNHALEEANLPKAAIYGTFRLGVGVTPESDLDLMLPVTQMPDVRRYYRVFRKLTLATRGTFGVWRRSPASQRKPWTALSASFGDLDIGIALLGHSWYAKLDAAYTKAHDRLEQDELLNEHFLALRAEGRKEEAYRLVDIPAGLSDRALQATSWLEDGLTFAWYHKR